MKMISRRRHESTRLFQVNRAHLAQPLVRLHQVGVPVTHVTTEPEVHRRFLSLKKIRAACGAHCDVRFQLFPRTTDKLLGVIVFVSREHCCCCCHSP